jgi:hypothetical protein
VALLALVPAARAGSLLSGYGGPGQGSQALLGSTLIGGSGGGGGGGSSSGGSPGSLASLQARPAATPAACGAGRHSAAHVRGRPTAATRASSVAVPAVVAGRTLAGTPETGAGSSTLGLSTADFVYLIAVLAGLVLVAMLTRRLARDTRQSAPD